MPAAKIKTFGGMIPAQDDRLLPDQAAARSENTWLYSGALRGIPAPKFLRNCATATTSKVYRIPNNFNDAAHLADADWLDFEDPETDVIRAPVHGDTFDRYYWASSSSAPRYNTRARIKAASAPFILGIPAPGTAPGVVVTGGSGTTETRAYVYTRVSAYGEEGPPSPPTVVTGFVSGSWGLTFTAAAPGDLGTDRNLTLTRIYRTMSSVGGGASFFLVAEIAIATLSYADTIANSVVSANSILPSTNWSAPPSNLQGWVVMPNGIIAGWRESEVWFSEPYRPHAWPAAYTLTVDYPVVGLGVIGQTLVVCTQGFPTAITGVHPSSMTEARLANFEPCMSRGSIVSAPEGVYYASPNGLIVVSQGAGAVNVTRDLITKDRWQDLTPIATLRAARLGAAYYAFGSVRFGVFEPTAFETTAFTQEDFTGAYVGVLIDPTNQRVAFNALASTAPNVNSFNDAWSGELFLIRGGKLYWVDIADDETTVEVFKWKSKIFELPSGTNFAAMKVTFNVPTSAPALNPVRNTNLVQTLAADQWGLVRVYADGVLKCTRELRVSGELMRIPSGFVADAYQFEIEARVDVKSFQAATSARELAEV